MTRIEEAAEKVANNTLLAAGSRMAILVGIPVTLMIAAAWAAELTAMNRKVHGIEVQQASTIVTQAEVHRRLGALENQNSAEAGRFQILERQIAEMTGTVNAMNQNITRLLNRIDGARP